MKQQERLAVLKKLVSINTVADNEAQVADYLQRLFNEHGIQNKVVPQFPGRNNLVAEIGDGNGPKLAFSGHEDTVHQGHDQDWSTPPFEAVVQNDYIYGRGVTDMKSGLAAQAIALIELADAKVPIHGTMRFLATISEELTQGGANYLSQQGYVDDLDAIILGEPTGVPLVDVDTYFNSGGNHTDAQVITQLDADPNRQGNQHFLVNAHKGAFIYTVESFGKAAHSSTPKLGISAIDNLFNYRVAERELFDSFQANDPQLGFTIYTPDIFHGGQQVNSIPDYAYQKVMVRTIPQLPNELIEQHLCTLINKFNQRTGYQLKLTVTFSGNPVKTSADAKIIQIAQHQAVHDLKEPLSLPLMQISMGTDGSQFKQRNPNVELVVMGPGNNTAHQSNEYVDLNAYYRFIELYQDIAKQYLK